MALIEKHEELMEKVGRVEAEIADLQTRNVRLVATAHDMYVKAREPLWRERTGLEAEIRGIRRAMADAEAAQSV
jgi:hypothetical protein